jgi:VanZ family protein
VITYFSLVPPSEVPGAGLPDKFLHFAAYAGLAAILTLALGSRLVVTSVVLAAGLGAGLEVAQGLQGSGRQAEIADALANLAGAALGAGLVWWRLRRPAG